MVMKTQHLLGRRAVLLVTELATKVDDLLVRTFQSRRADTNLVKTKTANNAEKRSDGVKYHNACQDKKTRFVFTRKVQLLPHLT